MTKFYADKDAKKCICVITLKRRAKGFPKAFKGMAKCSPNDTYDEALGCNIAYTRALVKLKKAEVKYNQRMLAQAEELYNKCKTASEYNQRRLEEVTKELEELLAE
jgi:hypothetical protein